MDPSSMPESLKMMFPNGPPPPEAIEALKKIYPNGPPKSMEEMIKMGPPPPEVMALLMGGGKPQIPEKKPEATVPVAAEPSLKKMEKPAGPPPELTKMFPNGPPAGVTGPPPPEVLEALKKMGPPPGADMETLKKMFPNGPPAGVTGPPPPEVLEALKKMGPPPAAGSASGGPPPLFFELMKYGIRPPKGVLEGEERKAKEEEMEKMKESKDYTYSGKFPDSDGYFGIYGGLCDKDMKVNEKQKMSLVKAQIEAKKMMNEYIFTEEFKKDLDEIRKDFQGRPTPIYECKNIQKLINNGKCGRIFLKREDLNHTGAHKINHCMAQGLMAKKLGKKCLIAGTGAGQHGLATATAAAYFGMDCKIFMGTKDIVKEHPNVSKMKVLGAEVIPVDVEGKSLKEANDACLNYYIDNSDTSYQCIGSVVAVQPWPLLIREFQRCIGDEAREQLLEKVGKLPDHVVACIGGGSNSIGTFTAFIDDKDIKLYPVEPLGRGTKFGDHAACLLYGERGVLHGSYSYILKNEKGEFLSHSVASGLCYPSVGPEHALLKDITRTTPVGATDNEALEAFFLLSKKEGIIPALESAHGVVQAIKLAKQYPDSIILCNLSGRGDKDVDYVMENFPEFANKKEFDLLK